MEQEIWKDIPGYEGRYQASNMGCIKSLSRIINGQNQYGFYQWRSKERILKPGKHDKCGHFSVMLNDPRKCYPVHQLVMRSFCGEPPAGMCVLHTNGNPADNRLSNLRYDTQSENILDVYRQGKAWRRFTANEIIEIKVKLNSGIACNKLAKIYGVAHQTISKISTGRTYSWLKLNS